ncbi:Phosphatidylinositol N-acetylglucosaminyltransferase subunit H [Vespula maculifrons]|uniref:Phosphatidylinositol N-acetylglucosaminyltransferase subunit H n=1 Tax=Vespula maculifrons TaxID=7453 RepID=A0ABD2CFV0_VESMC
MAVAATPPKRTNETTTIDVMPEWQQKKFHYPKQVNVDGKKLGLSEGCSSPNFESYGVIKFILHNDEPVNVITSSLLLFCITLVLWIIFDSFVPSLLSTFTLVLYCKYYLTSTKKDILLIVPSIGIHITIEKTFAGFNSYTFLPWDTIEDLFINEVIIRVTKSLVLFDIYSERINQW